MHTDNLIPTLHVGQAVEWSGGFGNEPYETAIVIAIELCQDGHKYGQEVKSVLWQEISNKVVVTLNNGHWAYGTQIKPSKQYTHGR